MPETIVTIEGNLTADPEMRALPSGLVVSNFTVASTPRVKKGDDWEDGETLWVRVTAWRELAEGAMDTLRKGDSVIVKGKFGQQTYEAKDGSGPRISLVLNADAVGKSVRVRKSNGGGGSSSAGSNWGTPAANDEPPF